MEHQDEDLDLYSEEQESLRLQRAASSWQELLIEAVKAHPVLYDRTAPGKKDAETNFYAWEAVSTSLITDGHMNLAGRETSQFSL
jgi:hypothetical protein